MKLGYLLVILLLTFTTKTLYCTNNHYLKTHPQISHMFTLLTFLYNEKNVCRCAEYMATLEKNLQHHLIKRIHILYDVSNDDKNPENNFLFNYLKKQPITITLTAHRPTYGDFFALANKQYPKEQIIVSNADIFFNETLDLLKSYDFTGKFIALTRWNVQRDNQLVMRKDLISQDTWIFVTPLRKFENDDIMLGLNGCDPEIVYYAQKSGLCVTNPCLSIQCCHLHSSGVRNYILKDRPYKKEPPVLIPHTKLY